MLVSPAFHSYSPLFIFLTPLLFLSSFSLSFYLHVLSASPFLHFPFLSFFLDSALLCPSLKGCCSIGRKFAMENIRVQLTGERKVGMSWKIRDTTDSSLLCHFVKEGSYPVFLFRSLLNSFSKGEKRRRRNVKGIMNS